MNNRALALDALRGYAIITMVLSATIVTHVLPGWMSHAQTPPPDHVFNPLLPGITWVDLVFPFFLFAMGAAFPFSIKKRAEKGDSKLKLVYEAGKRGIQLTFFAIFIQHFYPYMLSSPQDIRAWLLAILCFAVLFPMFMRIPLKMPDWVHISIKVGAYIVAAIMLATTSYADGKTFSLFSSNIIILLLANMAIFGSILYIFTMHNRWMRLGILILLMAMIVGSTVAYGFTIVMLGVCRGKDIDFGVLFEGFQDYGRIFVTMLLQTVYTVLWSLLLVIPGIIKSYSYAMTSFILKDEPEMKNNAAIEKSKNTKDSPTNEA